MFLHASCENVATTAQKIKRSQINPVIEAVEGNRLQIVGTAGMAIEYGFTIVKGKVCLLQDVETGQTYLVGFGESGIVTFPGSPLMPAVSKKEK
jgi:hypothetical protein